MRLAVMLEPQFGLTYDEQLGVARDAERLGFHALYRSDHYGAGGDGDEPGSTDAWAVLAGLARETSTLRLGTLVSPATFRRAGNLAKVVATVAEMAGAHPAGTSRVDLGMGTGWMEREHTTHGFPFGTLAERFRRLEEQLQVVRGLWDPTAQPFTFAGAFEHVEDARSAPAPDPVPRVVLGGMGPRRTPRLAARYAEEWNTMLATPDDCAARRAALDEACAAEGRDPIPLTLMTPGLVGRSTDEVRARAARVLERLGRDADAGGYLARVAEIGLAGTPDAVVDRLGAYADAGVESVMLQHLAVDDTDMVELIADAVLPRLQA